MFHLSELRSPAGMEISINILREMSVCAHHRRLIRTNRLLLFNGVVNRIGNIQECQACCGTQKRIYFRRPPVVRRSNGAYGSLWWTMMSGDGRIGVESALFLCAYMYMYICVCVHNKERAIINEWNGMGRDDVTEQKRRPQNYTTARTAGRSRSNRGAGEGVGTR